MRFNLEFSATAAALGLALNVVSIVPAMAQSAGNQMGSFQAGYGGSRYSTATSSSGSTRDANGNRLIINGIIQSGASSYASGAGSASASAGSGQSGNGSTSIGGATAIGNNLNVVVQGNHNTVIVNSTQTNNGKVTAGTVLNGSLVLP